MANVIESAAANDIANRQKELGLWSFVGVLAMSGPAIFTGLNATCSRNDFPALFLMLFGLIGLFFTGIHLVVTQLVASVVRLKGITEPVTDTLRVLSCWRFIVGLCLSFLASYASILFFTGNTEAEFGCDSSTITFARAYTVALWILLALAGLYSIISHWSRTQALARLERLARDLEAQQELETPGQGGDDSGASDSDHMSDAFSNGTEFSKSDHSDHWEPERSTRR